MVPIKVLSIAQIDLCKDYSYLYKKQTNKEQNTPRPTKNIPTKKKTKT